VKENERKCPDCDMPLAKTPRAEYAYPYDNGKPIRLRGIAMWTCYSGNYREVEIPKIVLLHEAIERALSTLRVKREALTFYFDEGGNGAWGVSIVHRGKLIP
jgi:hypothetical protein